LAKKKQKIMFLNQSN